MRKCNVCGRRFRLLAKNRYEVVKRPVGLQCLTQGAVYYNAFDCPYCGCQNIVGVVEKDVEEYQISEDIAKGFEEFTKTMFKQGQTESEALDEDDYEDILKKIKEAGKSEE